MTANGWQGFSRMSFSLFAVWFADFLLDASILQQLSSKLREGKKQIRKLWQSQKSSREEMEETFFPHHTLLVDGMVRG